MAPFDQQHTIVAYNGSVIEHYPNFKEKCQQQLNTLVGASGAKSGVIELMYAEESSLLGAAVAVACLDK
jgi:hexokinase